MRTPKLTVSDSGSFAEIPFEEMPVLSEGIEWERLENLF
jgi:hypothetical protein